MKPRTIVISVMFVVFFLGIAYALYQEVVREETLLAGSLSGLVEVEPELFATGEADIVKTDRLVLILVEPDSQKAVALKFISPLVPPQTISIGQEDAMEGVTLEGAYLLIGITDKDGEIFKITPGEVYGRSPAPIALGSEQLRLRLTEPFRGSLFNNAQSAVASPGGSRRSAPASGGVRRGAAAASGNEANSIRGFVTVSDELREGVAPSDRLVILLFDVQAGRPIATKIIPHVLLPQAFSISAPPGTTGKSFGLRILTDKDGEPFRAAAGEVIGRSTAPIPLGTIGLQFELNQPYRR